MGKHSAPAPQPQQWEKAVGVGLDYGPQEGPGFKKGMTRLLIAGHEQQPTATDPRYKGFEASFKTLFPEAERIKMAAKNLIGRLAVWRTGKQAAEQRQMLDAHKAVQTVEAEITQQHQALPVQEHVPRHAYPTVNELVAQANRTSMQSLNAPTAYLPQIEKRDPNHTPRHDNSDNNDLVGANK